LTNELETAILYIVNKQTTGDQKMKPKNCLYCGKETTNGIYCNNNCRRSAHIEEEREEMIAEKDRAETKWDKVDREWDRRFD
jgi:hypothetical protein